MQLAIGGPTRDTVPASFAMDAAHLYEYTCRLGPWARVTLAFMAHTYIHCGRELFLEAAIKQGATHVLWLDTDMTFPRTAAVQLMAHGQPVVGCNYRSRRQGESRPVARLADGTRVETHRPSGGLQEVAELGFGVLLMETSVVAGFVRPWFRHGLNDFGGDVGEDIMFCRGLRAAGYPIYIDHDLSKQVGHIGQYIYSTVAEEAAIPV